MEPPTTAGRRQRASIPLSVEAATHIWYQNYCRNSNSDNLAATVDQAAGVMRALARRAEEALACPGLSSGVISVADQQRGVGVDQTQRCAELRDQARAVEFVRSASQCAEVALDLCARAALGGGNTQAVTSILNRMRCFVWPIMASAEPRLFWDPRPFWAGMDPLSTSGARVLWQLYVRLFLLVSFDRYQILRSQRLDQLATEKHHHHRHQQQQQQSPTLVEDAAETGARDPLLQRRAVRAPSDVGLGSGPDDEQDDADAETWPMSMLFAALDALADEWNQVLYTPAMVRLVARLLLRYGMLGYARSSPAARQRAQKQGDRCVHDLPEYTADPGSAGWLGVDRQAYYAEGGAALRDMLSDLCAVVHADVWISAKTHGGGDGGGPDVGAMLRTRPLAQRLWASLTLTDQQQQQQPAEDQLLACCRLCVLLNPHQVALHRAATMQEGARRCFASMHRFLQSGEAKEAEKCFVKSGVAQIILPGEVWRFVHRWPDHGATPINVVNGLRDRDMMLYRDRVMIPGAVSLAADPSKSLPGCLSPLVDHLVWETARHMTRMVAVGEGTEALPGFLMERHHVKSPDSTARGQSGSETQVWARFGVWSALVSEGIHDPRRSFAERQEQWEQTMRAITERAQLLGDIPPYPQVLLLGGRVLIWNPLARPYDALFDSDGVDDVDEDADDYEDYKEGCQLEEWAASPVVDASSDSAPMTLLLWLRGRRNLIEALMERVAPTTLLYSTIRARSQVYEDLTAQWLHKPAQKKQKSARE